MKRDLVRWTVSDLRARFREINFPEYQREPTVWHLEKKQRLIDSILRGFDIASIYFYRSGESEIDCIDGRQRINAIMSFLGQKDQPGAEDNAFKFQSTNEIYEEESPFREIEGKRYSDQHFQEWRSRIDKYELNIVEVSDISQPEELNLLFLRLQLGTILNSGEKLNAMTGEMRDYVFHTLSENAFFSSISIPYRRYARAQVAAQIAFNLFNRRDVGEFARTRYIDLQLFFKRFKVMDSDDRVLCKGISETAGALVHPLGDNIQLLKNRAITVSFFLYSHEILTEGVEGDLASFAKFYAEFISRLRWQIPKGLEMDPEYHDLIRFQTDVTQASVEKSAVARRHEFIHRYFSHYQKFGDMPGDKQYKERTGSPPGID